MAAVGKMCEPREKSQRVSGRERDAGWDLSMGMEKSEREAMPPEARRAVDMLRIWTACVEEVDMLAVGGRGNQEDWTGLCNYVWVSGEDVVVLYKCAEVGHVGHVGVEVEKTERVGSASRGVM
jgi:hypothetical protein